MKNGLQLITSIILLLVLTSASIIPSTTKFASVIVPDSSSAIKSTVTFHKGIKIAEVETRLVRKLTIWEKISFGLNKKKTIEALNDKPKAKIGIWGIMGIFTGLGFLFSFISLVLGALFLTAAAVAMFAGFIRITKRNKMSAMGSLGTIFLGGVISFFIFFLLFIYALIIVPSIQGH
jgi:hypothetical protein